MIEIVLKNLYVRLVLGLLALFLLVQVVAGFTKVYQEVKDNKRPQDTLNISATGEVEAKPDVAEASFGVMSEGSDPQKIQDDNSSKINKITDFLKNTGIKEDDIATENYNLYPRYNYTDSKQVLDGYTLTQTVNVKVRDLKKVGDILKGVVQNGANNINGLTFRIDDPESLKQEARKKALENAKAKAEDLAKVAGVRLGKVVNFSESDVSMPYPVMYDKAMPAVGMGGGGAAPDVQPGITTVTASVSVTFELK